MKAVPPAVGDVVARGVTFLFVPGDRPERFAKAADAGADVVIIDLEDAVAPGGYAIALANTVAALRETDLRALVRIHPSSSPDHASQVAHLSAMDISGLLGVMMAKAESRDEVESVRAAFAEEFAVIPLVESAAGLLASLEMASVPGVTRLAFGAVDFALDIGSGSAPEYLAYARSHLVVASRGAGVAPPLDSPSLEISDLAAVSAAARLSRDYGFGGKLSIHPAQLAAIVDGFAPTVAEFEWAERVIAAEGGAAQVNGQLVDRPVTDRARQILSRARST